MARSTSSTGNVMGVLAIDDAGNAFGGGSTNQQANQGIDLLPSGSVVTGTLQYASSDGSNITVNYMGAYGTQQGDCVFTGTIAEA